MSLSSSVVSVVSSFPCFGFSGSRSVVSASSVGAAVAALIASLPSTAPVFVGCARGVDGLVRSSLPASRLQVFSVSSGSFGVGRSAFARRSAACVAACVAVGGLWCSFPVNACPSGLLPSSSSSRAFSGSGSGSWASLAFAIGSGSACLLFAPAGVPSGWGFSSLEDDWWFVPAAPLQLSLF